MTDGEPPALVTQDLDNIPCGNPACQNPDHPLHLRSPCHDNAGVDVAYSGGVMVMRCHECQEVVCKVQIATAEVQ